MNDIFKAARERITRGTIEKYFSAPGAHWKGREFWTLNPTRHDTKIGSFSISEDGTCYDFSSGQGCDIISLLAESRRLDKLEAARLIAGETAEAAVPAKSGKNKPPAQIPVPEAAVPALKKITSSPDVVRRYGNLAALYAYRNAEGKLVFAVCRYERDGQKAIRPAYYTTSGKWVQGQPLENGRPLFRLLELTNAPEAAALVAEGEKDCLGAVEHLRAISRTDIQPVAWSGGAAAWGRTDWTPLHGRRVYIYPDNDEPGRKAADGIAELLKPYCDVWMIEPRQGAKPGEGAADISAETFSEMLDGARSLQALDALPMLEADAIVSRIWPEVVPRIIPDMLAQCTTEDGFSEVVTTVINGSIVYAPAFDEFFIKQHHEYYEPDTAGIVWHVIRLIARRLGDFRGLYTGDPRAIDQILKRMKTKTGLDAVYAMIKKSPSLIRMENELDPHGLIMTPDGAFDPLTCSRVARPGAVFTKQTNYSPDFNREPVEFLRFMESLFDDTGVVYRLLDLMAVAVAGQAPAIEKGPILAGSEAGSGKNQLAELTEAVFGAYFAWVRPEWLYENKAAAGDVPTSNIIRLIGKLFMVCSEPTDHPLNSSLYKTLVSGEALPSRKQHSTKFIDVTTRGLLLILANRKPYFHHDKGTRRRIENYEFSKSFYDSPDRVEDIGRKIARAEGPAILGHLMTRARDWHLRGGGLGGLYYSQAVEQWTNDFLGWGDSIGRFIGDEIERSQDGKEAVSDVWQRFKRWAENNGESIMSVRALGEALSERGIKRKRRNTGMYFEGIILK
ncbi:MAG: hypothetical protein AB2L13_10600 [Spirochaetota bacterium]